MKWKKIKKFRKKLRKRKRRVASTTPRWQPVRNQLDDVSQCNIFDRTGLFEDTFENIYQETRSMIVQPRNGPGLKTTSTSLSPRARLLLVLQWLRHYPCLTILRDIYKVSTTYISREIKHILPILYVTLRGIKWPDKWNPSGRFGAHGKVDCTSHPRWRVHPRQSDYYRGDKHCHFITAQVVSNMSHRICNVQLGLGHNNDQGMFSLTGLKEYIEENEIYLLVDGGYHHHRLIGPSNVPGRVELVQKDERSEIEVIIGMAKGFGFAGGVVRHAPEVQEVGLMVVYEFANIKLTDTLPF